jgi:triphosphoribosyl-dephospho-CoA synthase
VLATALGDGLAVRDAIVELHLRLLAHTPDTLIARKAGADAAARVSAGAREVLAGRRTLESFDASLRTEGNKLNPGTTADLVTATVFVALVEGMLAPSSPLS